MDVTPSTDLNVQFKLSHYITDHFNKEQPQPAALIKPHKPERGNLIAKWSTSHLTKKAINSNSRTTKVINTQLFSIFFLSKNQRVTMQITLYMEGL